MSSDSCGVVSSVCVVVSVNVSVVVAVIVFVASVDIVVVLVCVAGSLFSEHLVDRSSKIPLAGMIAICG